MTEAAPIAPVAQQTVQEVVLRLAIAGGFAHAGVAPVEREEEQQPGYFEEWIERGYGGDMEYLKRRDAEGQLLRSSIAAAAPWARSVIVCVAPYHADAALSIDPAPAGTGWIGRYAWSGSLTLAGELRPADYHKVLLARLKRLEQALHTELGEFRSWAYVDTGPVIERSWAAMAGVGWTGKNTCTLNQQLGSFFFLGVILTSLPVSLEARAALAMDRCGSCTRCIDACPTRALVEPHRMDASRCIAYLTIEKRGSIAEELRSGMGRQVFGCDICQDVCPWNRKAPFAADPFMMPRAELVSPPLTWLAQLTEEEFGQLFYGSAVKRATFAGLRRNVAIAMGNSGEGVFLPQLCAWARGEDPVLAEAAEWAIAHLTALGASSVDG